MSTFALDADGSTYRLRPLMSTRQSRVLGTMSTFGKAAKTWDATYRVPLTDEVWVDDVDANRSIARSVYDMTTGNVTQHWKPKQNVAGTTSTTLTYDDRKLFVTTEINEVGHQRDYLYEYGTGTKLQTDGPNQRACVTGPGCQLNATHPLKEQRKIRVDGIGRPIENWQTLSDDGRSYNLYKLETNTYVDAALGGIPTSTTNQVLLDVAGPVWKQQKTDLDGHGRPTKITVYAQGSAPNDQITSFVYRADGTLQSVSIPDPTTNNASVVTYNYGFDSLGRATSIRRPDSTTPASQSGVDVVYDGVTRSTTEVVGTAGGQPAMTKTTNDSFGRLKEVDERTAITPLTFAQTVYAYGPDDNVATITAPQGVITTFFHDFAGRRTKIARHGREWKYTYDANGNRIAEQVPGSTGPPTDPLFKTTIVYDDLDRPKSKSIAPRNLTPADRALFVSGTEEYEWDTGPNHKGYLRYWSAFAPGTGTSDLSTSSFNDNQGRTTSIGHSAMIAGYPNLSRAYAQSWFAFGGVKRKTYRDFVGGTNQTEVDYLYDPRGLRSSAHINTPISQAVAIQTRNVAGLVTTRRTNTTGAMTFVESNWTYDNLGRVTDQVVQQGPSATQVARQTLTYLGNDDPRTLQHSLGTNSRQFTYDYDLRHQLTGVATDTSSYFGATYQYGPGGKLTSANETRTIMPIPAGGNLAVRNVNYVYGDADPERVTALTNVSDGERYATYAYDAAGNQTWKCSGAIYTPICQGESFDYLYDGKDQLRRATRKINSVVQGSEEYWYDGNGQRILIVKRDATGVKTELVWFIGDVEAHYDATGTVTKVYSHLSMGTPVARVERTGNTTTAIEYQFHGLASSTIAAVAQTGTVNASFSYAPFGEVLEATDAGGPGAGTAAHKRRLNDKVEDDLTALGYYGARYYDKTLIGWTQSDPLFRFAPDAVWLQPRRASLYAFTGNSPLRYIDMDGRNFADAIGGVLIALGEAAGEAAAIVEAGTVAVLSSPVWVGVAAVGGTVAVGYLLRGQGDIDGGDPRGIPHRVLADSLIASAAEHRALWGAAAPVIDYPNSPVFPPQTAQEDPPPPLPFPNLNPNPKPQPNRYPKKKDDINPIRPYRPEPKHEDLLDLLSSRPADLDRNGTVTDEEESAWMKQQNGR
jgi:RHS repeat-associated protein